MEPKVLPMTCHMTQVLSFITITLTWAMINVYLSHVVYISLIASLDLYVTVLHTHTNHLLLLLQCI